MAKQIPDDFLQQLRNMPITEVAESYFNLNKVSNSLYQTNCIHEGDNSPSLSFFPTTNTFFCFGCGAGKKPKTEGSDVISFVMWVDNCSFAEAIQKLAAMKGVEVPKTAMSREDKERQMMYAQAMDLNREYWKHLQDNEQALTYLKDRGILKAEIDKWRIGYVPADSGDRHAGKIVFPLMNDWGITVGFSYRDMTQEFTGEPRTGPKYINSKASPIFDKGSIFYGLNFVKKEIRDRGYVIIGEGFGDAIMAQRLNLPFVSTMGTSLTDKHIQILKQYTNTVILWMDGDHGGITATSRHAKALRAAGFIVKVINYMGKDPDDIFIEILRENTTVRKAIAQAQWIVDNNAVLASQFDIDQILSKYQSDLTEMQMQTVAAAQKILNEMEDGAEKVFTAKRIATALDVPIEDLLK